MTRQIRVRNYAKEKPRVGQFVFLFGEDSYGIREWVPATYTPGWHSDFRGGHVRGAGGVSTFMRPIKWFPLSELGR